MKALLLLASYLLAPAIAAQANAASTHALLQLETSAGGRSQSATYVMQGALGSPVVTRPARSSRYRLDGGFPSSLANPPSPTRPWLTGVTPLRMILNTPATLMLHGTALDRGSNPIVHVGSQIARVLTRARDNIVVEIPGPSVPGWQVVSVETSAGRSFVERGVAVLPLIETHPAAADGVPFALLFRGSRGDQVLWAIGIAAGTPLRVGAAHFGFALVPPNFLVLSGATITAPNGELRWRLPGRKYPTGAIYLQGFFLSAGSAYAPAAFSNVLRI